MFNQQLFYVNLQGWNSIFDEMIPSTSNRIASSGFFTQRQDIPQYHFNNQNNPNGEGDGAMSGVLLIGEGGQANLEGNIEEDELSTMDIQEAQSDDVNNLDIKTQTSLKQKITEPFNINLKAEKIFESIFKVRLQDFA